MFLTIKILEWKISNPSYLFWSLKIQSTPLGLWFVKVQDLYSLGFGNLIFNLN